MLKLILLRHAKTNQMSETGRDYDRKLLPKGNNQGKALDHYFKSNPLENVGVLVSSAKRTRQTFEWIQGNFNATSVRFLDHLYLCSSKEIFDEICSENYFNQLLIVGHNFGISDLASYLTEKPIELRTGELVEIHFECETWQEVSKGTGTIAAQYRPQV